MLARFKSLTKNLGPGLLMAATAIGVSHIVQSVQAGANYGYELIWAIIFIHIVKYPFFLASPKYASHTKKSLLEGYYELSPIYLIICLTLSFVMVFAMVALVFLVGSAIIANIFTINLSSQALTIIYMIVCALILFFGRYSFLDTLIKPIILLMVITTFVALAIAASKLSGEPLLFEAKKFDVFNKMDFLFFVSFLGWMPATLDVAIWNSLWTAKKHENDQEKTTYKQIKLDFDIGYVVTAVLAILFVMLGKIVFYEKVSDLPANAIPFIGAFLEIYTKNLGQASYMIVALGAFFTMFSTVISVLDGFSRTFAKGLNILNTKSNSANPTLNIEEKNIYNIVLLVIIFGASMILLFFMKNMKELVLMTTIGSFIATSIIAILNLKISLNLRKVCQEFSMSKISVFFHYLCLICMLSLSVAVIMAFLS